MKKLLLIALTLFVMQANAVVHTVNNVTGGGAQFTTINAAIAAATMGDTIYVHGSPIVYAAFNILDKKLTIIGPGWAPQKNNPVRAIIFSATIKNSGATSAVATSNGTELQGLVFNNTISFSANSINERGVSNIRLDRCELRNGIESSGYDANNYIIENCYISGSVARISLSTSNSYSNFLFQNNIFRIDGFNNGFLSGFLNISNFIFNHNLFMTNAPGAAGSLAVNNGVAKTLTFSNNIFVNINLNSGIESCTFNSNLTFYSSVPALTAPWAAGNVANNIDGGGNLNNVNPQMAAQTAVNTGVDNIIADFTIAAGPANNAGNDGKDLGLLFDATGSLNWVSARGARLPFIFSMNITNPTVSPGTNLNVEVTAKKNN
ncbi:hypothetical protein EZ456_10235 [Pedobacter psychrodurus]|uniref:Right handed beta helix domain-containing protein n=1 Tax=Pedobacter psychrodurus TaxID=2530456 RepID=A0A4R0PW16_9SPHI|nr:hypothetical protein [Pedobacter psychrodurus]TCD26902.1 hypothetical protein EZ456_10235 [Pedobacter psychrodurus]